jgi:MFS family permease
MSSGYRAYVLFILVVVYTFNFIDRVIVGILAQPIKVDLGLTDTQLGWMGGPAFAVFYTFLGIPIARLADRTSRTWIMTGALALWSGFTALCGQAQSFWQLLAARAGVGVGEAGGVAPAYALVSDYFPAQQRARALAVFSFGIPIGSGLGFLFGGLVASALSWRTAFIMVGIAGLVLAPLFRLTVAEPVRGGLDAHVGRGRSWSVGEVLRAIAGKKSFWGLSFGAACSSIVGYGLLFWLPSFFIRVHGLPLADTSLLVGLGIIVFQTAGIWVGGWAGDKFGARSKGAYALVPALLLAIVVPFLITGALAPSLGVALLMFIVPLMLNAAWLGPVLSALQHVVVPGQRATASAIFLFINNLIGIGGGSLFMGVMSDVFMTQHGNESLRYAMVTASGFYVLSVSLLYFASRHLDRDWEHA